MIACIYGWREFVDLDRHFTVAKKKKKKTINEIEPRMLASKEKKYVLKTFEKIETHYIIFVWECYFLKYFLY